MIEAKIVADSIAPSGVRITTFVLTYPRFIHSEFMTHRMFSRNASSSRAIPVKKSIQMVIDNPVIPIAFTKNQKGMQGGEVLDDKAHELAVRTWLHARDHAVAMATMLADLEVHKQYANRILEPFSHITVVCTATDWDNFFTLRCHEAAQPEIHALADKMYSEYQNNTPQQLESGQWHAPFTDNPGGIRGLTEMLEMDMEPDLRLKKSVARCARVSYLNHEGKHPTTEEDLQLYNRLVGSAPIHASPAEHQAMATGDSNVRSGNFRGWIQYRKTLKDENVTEFKGS
jgi:thymidylate synthase ThyX